MPQEEKDPEILLHEQEITEEERCYAERRSTLVSSLLSLADLFEHNPQIPIPQYDLYLHINDCSKEQLQDVTHLGYKVEKVYTNNDFYLKLRLGEYGRWKSHAIVLTFSAPREEVCERVVVGKKHIPEEYIPGRVVEAHDEEIVEWKCKPLLAEELGEER